MLGFFLFLLKVLGIIILCILALVLLILLLVFFAPIRYTSEGSRYNDDLKVTAKITYLNPIVRVKACYPNDEIICVKILGITVFSSKSKEKPIVKQNENNKKETKTAGHTSKTCKKVEQTCEKQSVVNQKEGNGSVSQEQNKTREEVNVDSQENIQKNGALDRISYYISLYTENKELIIDVFKTILKSLKTILPRKCKINITFGTGQADTTGFIYGAYCSLKDFLPGDICMEPVWIESCAEGEYYLKGKIRIIHFLVAVIRIIANKKVRLLIKKLRRL